MVITSVSVETTRLIKFAKFLRRPPLSGTCRQRLEKRNWRSHASLELFAMMSSKMLDSFLAV